MLMSPTGVDTAKVASSPFLSFPPVLVFSSGFSNKIKYERSGSGDETEKL